MKGFAIGITLLFLFLLTLLGFSILLVAGSYYSSVRNLMENENARILCETAVDEIVDRHNLDSATPRFFFDPSSWQSLAMKPYKKMGYQISARFSQVWTPLGVNQLTVSARKGPYLAEQRAGISQIHLENFALYSDASPSLPQSSLFDGLVFVRDSMGLQQPAVRFLEITQGNFFPEDYASFKKPTKKVLSYPEINNLFNLENFVSLASSTGLAISGKNPLFWQGGSYLIDLDQLQIERQGLKWQIGYRGTVLSTLSNLILWFDDRVIVRQADHAVTFNLSEKPKIPLYIGSSSELVVESNVLPVDETAIAHPLCLISAGAIRISSQVPLASRFQACLIALGTDPAGASLVVEPGGAPLAPLQKDQFLFEVNTSSFLFEDSKRIAVKNALEAQQKIVWFRGSVILKSVWNFSGDLNEVHFQASQDSYPLLPPFPFVRIAEGSRQWR
jgi:hypothetical protein